jgi:hypothetical protein
MYDNDKANELYNQFDKKRISLMYSLELGLITDKEAKKQEKVLFTIYLLKTFQNGNAHTKKQTIQNTIHLLNEFTN